jgi:MerR family transcriptional regulator, copper efflux regulator
MACQPPLTGPVHPNHAASAWLVITCRAAFAVGHPGDISASHGSTSRNVGAAGDGQHRQFHGTPPTQAWVAADRLLIPTVRIPVHWMVKRYPGVMLIGDLAAVGGLSAKAIRFYEQAGLLPGPPRTPAGYRDYPPRMVERLAFIRQAQAAGFTLAEIRGILAVRDSGAAPCRHVTALIGQHLEQVEQRIAELTRARDALSRLQRRAAATDAAKCAESEICMILTGPDRPCAGPCNRGPGTQMPSSMITASHVASSG